MALAIIYLVVLIAWLLSGVWGIYRKPAENLILPSGGICAFVIAVIIFAKFFLPELK